MMCKPRLSTQLVRPMTKTHKDTQCIHVWPDNGKKYIIHNIYNPPSCRLNVEQYLPTHFNTIYTGDFNRHSPLWGYPDHKATGHIIEDMLTASNLPLLHDEAATPTLYHRSTGTTNTPYLGPNPSLRRHYEQTTVTRVRRHRKRSQTCHPSHLQNICYLILGNVNVCTQGLEILA